MLHLIDYIKSKSIQEFYLDSEKYKLLEIYFDNEIPADIEEKFANDSSKDYILEFLTTQNYMNVLKDLDKTFTNNEILGYHKESNNEKTPIICLQVSRENKNIVNNEKFKNILSKYLYKYSTSRYIGNNLFDIMIEPIYPETIDISSKLHYGKYVYHVTSKENADKILKTGLRPRKNLSNREYDPRVYFIASNTDIHNKLKSIINSVYDGDESKCVILKIELPIRNINVYKDETRANDDYSFYTYSPIPANYISKTNLKTL